MKKEDRLINWEATDKTDRNSNGIDDSIEPPAVNIEGGSHELAERFRENPNSSPTLSGGDIDAQWEMAESGGDETVAGSIAVPGQNQVDEIGAAMGITYADDEELKVGEKERSRDKQRWELDPASSEDYAERAKESSGK